MHALVVINPIAGRGRTAHMRECAALARDVLGRHGYRVDVMATGARGEARAAAARARDEGTSLVVAWGGDGTVNEVATAIAETDVALAIVPAGSGNGLATDLGLPRSPARALDVAGSGRVREIDVGDLDGSRFVNVAGIGLDAEIAHRIARPGARRGLAGYILAAWREWPFYRPRDYIVTGTPIRFEGPALFIAIANSRQYGNGARIAPAARLDDGKLDLVVVEAMPFLRVATKIPAFFRGTLADGGGLVMKQVQDADIRADRPIRYHVDGEPREGGLAVAVQVTRQALRIKVV
jgi:YegS/Rv2252/BmrU family lipid kinase